SEAGLRRPLEPRALGGDARALGVVEHAVRDLRCRAVLAAGLLYLRGIRIVVLAAAGSRCEEQHPGHDTPVTTLHGVPNLSRRQSGFRRTGFRSLSKAGIKP